MSLMSNSNDYPPQQPYPQGFPSYPQAPQQQPPKKKKTGLIIGIIIGALVLCGLCGGIGSMMSHSGNTATTSTADTTTTSSSNTSSSTTTTKAAPTTAPAKPLTWTTTHKFSGNGTKKTDVFQVADTWKIKYSCRGQGQGIDGVLGVTVYGGDGTIQDVAVNATCKDGLTTMDTTTEHQGGQVYLDINGTGDWTVDVLEQK